MKPIEEILAVTRIDDVHFEGPAVPAPLRRTFGGQLVAQSLMAAVATAPEHARVHSMQANFIGPANAAEPVLLTVDPIRDGKSYFDRAVTLTQNGNRLFTMHVGLNAGTDTGPFHHDVIPDVPHAEDIVMNMDDYDENVRFLLKMWSDWDLREVPTAAVNDDTRESSRRMVWARSKHRLADDYHVHLGSLAYISDMTLLSTTLVDHPTEAVQMASLNHTLWFVAPFRADEWLLIDQFSPSAHLGRGIAFARFYREDGTLVAVATQQGLIRHLRSGGEVLPVTNPGD